MIIILVTALILTLIGAYGIYVELESSRESRDFWFESTERVWGYKREQADDLLAVIRVREDELQTYIKAHNLLCEENICLIRSVKEAQQETALANVDAADSRLRYADLLDKLPNLAVVLEEEPLPRRPPMTPRKAKKK